MPGLSVRGLLFLVRGSGVLPNRAKSQGSARNDLGKDFQDKNTTGLSLGSSDNRFSFQSRTDVGSPGSRNFVRTTFLQKLEVAVVDYFHNST